MRSSSFAAPESKQSILLVDDVRDGLIARRTVLAGLGYKVATAANGHEALELIQAASEPFDLVVTDYKMPGMDGLELIGRLREICPSTKIILLSGAVDILGMTAANTRTDAVLAKCSGELDHLTRAVRSVLAKKPARKPAASQKSGPGFMVKSS